ncbi:unnamed protein product [Closterium sp. Yama58-4]|nr:unnamed protein product [Closterium sp. Yama58-4]
MLGPDDGGFSFFGGASSTATATSTRVTEPTAASLHPFAAFSTPKQPPATKLNGTASNTSPPTTTSHPFRPPGKSQPNTSTSPLPSPPMVAVASQHCSLSLPSPRLPHAAPGGYTHGRGYRMQHQGAIRMAEVRRHKREDDAWTVVRGRVYNITPYLDFHPGGKEMLMKGAGKDCTALFSTLTLPPPTHSSSSAPGIQ